VLNFVKHRNADALSRRSVDGNDFKATTAYAVNSENSQMEDIWAPAALASAQASDQEFDPLYQLRLNSDDPPPISAVQRCGEECKVFFGAVAAVMYARQGTVSLIFSG